MTNRPAAAPLRIRTGWRPACVLAVLAAAFLSPPDPISMAVFAVPLLGLYEVGVFSARVAEKKEGRPSRDAPR